MISENNNGIHSKDDLQIKNLSLYVACIDNALKGNDGIVISGGKTVVISNSGMNSALDTESGYTYTAGSVVAIMPQGGMSGESTHCDNFSSIGSSQKLSLTSNSYLVVDIKNTTATIKMPVSLSANVIVLGDNSPKISTENETSVALDENGVAWN